MKFSWKIFINTFLMVLLALSLGETLLISVTFKKLLDTEVERVKKDNQTMRIEIATLMGSHNKSNYWREQKTLEYILKTLGMNWKAENKQYRIKNKKGNILTENIVYIPFQTMKEEAADERVLSYKIYQNKESYYIQMKSYQNIGKQEIIIENTEDISSIFITRINQREVLLKIILIVGSICAVLNWFITIWIVKPVNALTKATNEITNGNMKTRVRISSKDEIGKLTVDFNRMAESLEEKVYELEETARKQEDFVGSFAHEIKTPLTSIIGYADLLRSKKLNEDITFTAANYIFTEGKRLESVSLKLLELLVEKNKDIVFNNVSLLKIIEEVVAIMKPSLDEKEIHVSFEAEDVKVRIEEDLMKTVIINLIDNAKKAVDQNGMIQMKACVHDQEAMIRISDNGKGIPKEELPKVIEAFYMVDKSRSRKEGGAGLGLAICSQIMKLHEGKITVESELGKGTSVTLIWKGISNE